MIIIYILYLSRIIKIKCQLYFIVCISLILIIYTFDPMKQKTESDAKIKEIYIFDEPFNKIIKESFNELIKKKNMEFYNLFPYLF